MKDDFIGDYKTYITREGADKLLEWLISSDFFAAPASTRHHLAEPGGLVAHSYNVWQRLRALVAAEQDAGNTMFTGFSDETVAICGLLHDICKANYYKTEMRNAKDENDRWVKIPYYTVDDQLPYGHGEKSVYIVSAYMRLSRDEAMAIRWHMGGFDDTAKGGGYSMSAAFGKYPLAVLLHSADLQATYIDEAR